MQAGYSLFQAASSHEKLCLCLSMLSATCWLTLALLALGTLGIKGQFLTIAANNATYVVLPTSSQTEGAEEDNGKAEV